MNLELKLKLYKTLFDWINDNCEEDYFPTTYLGEKTLDLMVEATASVFDAVEEVQVYLKKEGDLS